MNTPKKISLEPDAAGLFWESRVSAALGVPRKVLATLRGKYLTEGAQADFVRGEYNAVALTSPGLAKMEGLLKATDEGKIDLLQSAAGKTGGKLSPEDEPKSDIPAGPPRREEMVVDRVAQNGVLLLCVSKSSKAIVCVRVRDNSNFVAGMEIEAIESRDGVWQFRNRPTSDESTVGRLPRGKGKW